MSTIKAEKVMLMVSYTCPMCDKEVAMILRPEQVNTYKLSSIYDDVDDGSEWTYDDTCPDCRTRNEVQLYRDQPFGY